MDNFIFADSVMSYENYAKTDHEHYDWRIAIPSYKRSETLRDKTLAMLERHNIDPDRIDVFVANEEQMHEYQSVLPQGKYSRIIVGVVGMMNIRNFIQNYYPEGQLIVCLDDDLKDVYKIDKATNKADVEDLAALFDYAFAICQHKKSDYFGIYAASNAFFMSRTVSLGLRYLIGSFWGMRVTHDPATYVTMDDKEDFERSVRAYVKCKTVVRLDFISVVSNYYGEKGGMQEERTEERVYASGQLLISMFPHLVKINTARKSHFEVKLVEQRPEYKKRASRKLTFIE